MCGIAALINTKPTDGALIQRMTDIVSYRGPDGDGHNGFDGNRVWLGQRRLAIIDLSNAGREPMSYKNERYWITYNGEVYNYIELRRELEAVGYVFASKTDTEVVLAAYDYWGTECLHRFNGMWAFVLYDTLTKRTFVARDRFGVKPLYYYKTTDGGYAFASEIKQFSVLPGWRYSMNRQRVADFLGYAISDHTDETMYDRVLQLRGGECAEITYEAQTVRFEKRRWYSFPDTQFDGTYEDATKQFLNVFTDAVRLRLRSDVPVGSCLSGGLDSSSIVCLLHDMLSTQNTTALQKTFSAYAREQAYDESRYAEEVIRAIRVEAHHVYPDFETLFDTLDTLLWHQDEPFGSASIYAQWHVFRLAKSGGVTVMLDGQGSDEQLAGYYPFYGTRLAELLVRGRWIRLVREIQKTIREGHVNRGAVLRRLIGALIPNAWMPFMPSDSQSSNDWFDMEKLGARSIHWRQQYGEFKPDVNTALRVQLTRTNLPMLLHWEDRNSMAHSIEARVPFLDYRLVEFILSLPSDHKISNATTKRVLRDSMKGYVPESIIQRRDKMGFVTPEEHWVRTHPDVFRKQLSSSIERSGGILRSSLRDDFDAMIAGKKAYDGRYWRGIVFGRWVRSDSM